MDEKSEVSIFRLLSLNVICSRFLVAFTLKVFKLHGRVIVVLELN